MKILLWGKGDMFSCLMEHATWRKDCEIIGIIESKKDKDYFDYGGGFAYMSLMKYNRCNMI